MKERDKKISIIYPVLIYILIAVAMVVLSFIYYSSSKNDLILNEQQRLLTLSRSISKSIEDFFMAEIRVIKILVENNYFKEQFISFRKNESSDIFEFLNNYMHTSGDWVNYIQIIDTDGKLLAASAQRGFDAPVLAENDEIAHVLEKRTSYTTDVHFVEGFSPFVLLMEPIIIEEQVEAIFVCKIETEVIYHHIVAPVDTGPTGYASVKTNDGILLMHPDSSDVGREIITARSEKYPEYDWSELRSIVEEQKTGKAGIGVYHSVWAGDESGTLVKKFNAYFPAQIGEDFWIVNISSDYNTLVEGLRSNYSITIIGVTLILFSLFLAAFRYIKSKHVQKTMKKELVLLDRLKELNVDLLKTQGVIIQSLGNLAEHRDPETGEHLIRTSLYVESLINQLIENNVYTEELSSDKKEAMVKFAPVHDIGKVAVQDYILHKPGKLTVSEFEIMKTHTLHGRDIIAKAEKELGAANFLKIAEEIVYSHHEKWDGTGYPLGLSGKDIPLSARIMALADVYDALRSKRIYKQAFTHEKSVEIIKNDSGKHFDPLIVTAFLEIEETFKDKSIEFPD